MEWRTVSMIVTALATASCGERAEQATEAGTANHAAPAAARVAAENRSEGAADASTPAPAPEAIAAVGTTLAADGLSPGLTFGMGRDEAVKAAAARFGAPSREEHNDECGEGPMDFVHFADLQLGFQEGKFAGWSLSGATPVLKTAGGIGIGTPRSALGDRPVDEESSIGPEFDVDGVGGFLGEDGSVMALWAGLPCQFR